MKSTPHHPRRPVLSALFLLATALWPNAGWPNGGHEHAKPVAPAIAPQGAPVADLVSAFAVSDTFELLAKYSPIASSSGTTVTLYLSDYRTNRPIAEATIKIELTGTAAFSGTAAAGSAPGEYVVELAFPSDGEYAASAIVKAGEVVDLLEITGIKVGAEYYPATTTPASSERLPSSRKIVVIAIGLVALALLFAGLARAARGRAGGPGAVALLVACRLLAPSPAAGHGGDDHGEAAAGPTRDLGDPVTVLKPVQFLLGIETDIVERHRLAERLSLVARIESAPGGSAAIVAPFDGMISFPGGRIYTPGMPVRSGETLAFIEPVFDPNQELDFTSRKRAAEAGARNAESDLMVAQTNWDRAQQLERVLSQKERQAIEAAYRNAEANVDAARNVLRSFAAVEGRAGRMPILSPIDGVIAAIQFSPGNVISKSSPLLEVVDLTKLWAHGEVYENQIRRLGAAARAVVVVPALGQTYETRLISRGYSIDVHSRTSHVYFEILNPDAGLIPNLTATLLVETGEAEATLAVAREALLEVDGKQIVFVLTAPEVFVAREVLTGWQDMTWVEIVKGIRAGERVVVTGNYQLRAAAGRGAR